MRWLLVGITLLIAVGSALQRQAVQVALPAAQSSCEGVIDSTTGCVMPMLGGAR